MKPNIVSAPRKQPKGPIGAETLEEQAEMPEPSDPQPERPDAPEPPRDDERLELGAEGDLREEEDDSPARVLVVEPDPASRDDLVRTLRDRAVICDPVKTAAEAVGALSGADYDAAVIRLELDDGSGLEVLRRLHWERPHTKAVMTGQSPQVEQAVAAMRLGAVDMVTNPEDQAEVVASVSTAVDLSRRERRREQRLEQLRRTCRLLNSARREVTSQVDSLCEDLAGAYQELTEQFNQASLANEFAAVVGDELEIETLLRNALEYMLGKSGPTNAAVFLPSNHADFSLGAYVNYDVPKESVEMLFDHLGDVLAPQFQHAEDIQTFETDEQLRDRLGDDANWLEGSRLIVFPCTHDEECLAVAAFFRDQSTPYPDEFIPQLRVLRDVFAEQLARVIRVHHRRRPDADWLEGEDDEDDFGLAA